LGVKAEFSKTPTDAKEFPVADSLTEKVSKYLPEEFRDRFPVVVKVLERASILWSALFGPLVWSLMCKHYIIGFDPIEEALYLFRMRQGLFGLGAVRSIETLPVEQLDAVRLSSGMLNATLHVRRADGSRIKLFAPLPSRKNAKEIYQAICNAQASVLC
jgi:hypothetical protein